MSIKTWRYIIAGILVLGAAGLYLVDAQFTPFNLKKERAAARAAGLPLTKAEFVRRRPPASRDAGPEWLAISATLTKHPLDTKPIDRLMGKNGAMTPQAVPLIRHTLRERSDLLARIHRAAAKPEAYFEHDYTEFELVPYLKHMRTVSRLLRWESALLAREGRYAEAIRTQEMGLNIADQLAADPTMIGVLVSIAINTISCAGMEDILHKAGPNPRVATLVEQAMRRHPVKTSVANAMKGDVVAGVSAIRSLDTIFREGATVDSAFGEGKREVSGGASLLVRRYITDQGEAAYLYWMRDMHAAAQRKVQRRYYMGAVAGLAEAAGKKHRLQRHHYQLVNKLLPLYAKTEDRNQVLEARHGVIISAARVLAYRGRTGTWPDQLLEAVRKPPQDPFMSGPIGYRNEGRAFVVYSKGPDMMFKAWLGQPEKNQAFFRYPRGATPSSFEVTKGPGYEIVVGGPMAPAPMPGGPPMPGR